MAIFHVSILLLLALSSLTSGSPVSYPLDLSSHSQFSANAATTMAGKYKHARALIPPSQTLNPRGRPPVKWQAPNSGTFVLIDFGHAVAGTAITDLLADAYEIVHGMIQQAGDGLIRGGKFDVLLHGYEVLFENKNNHQQTWGVVGEAIAAVFSYMTNGPGTPGTCSFQIFDGKNEVGWGQIEQAQSNLV